MKKLLSFTVALLLAVTGIIGCAQKNGDGFNTIRLNEVTHSVFYAPLYVAIEKGFFKDEKINIELTNGGGADKSMTAVISGHADIGRMGPEAAIYVYNEGRKDYPVVFGCLTRKDGSFLMSRTRQDNFEWSDIEGKEVIGGRRGGAPAMALESALKKNGLINGENFTLRYDIEFNLITPSFESGIGDFCTMFEPAASNFVKQGKGYIVSSVGVEAGEMPFTAFMSTKSYITNKNELVTAFLRAVKKGMDFVWNNSETVVAEAIKGQFTDTDVELLASSVKNYKEINAYMNTPVLEEDHFNRLQDVIIQAGIITERASYADLVNTAIARSLT